MKKITSINLLELSLNKLAEAKAFIEKERFIFNEHMREQSLIYETKTKAALQESTELENVITTFVLSNKDKIFAGAKSKSFPRATLKLRKSPDSVELLDDPEIVTSIINEDPDWSPILLRVKYEVNKKNVMEHWKSGLITTDILHNLSLDISIGEDKLTIDTK
jgi:phage host-nuclease inhibitor protein Gam